MRRLFVVALFLAFACEPAATPSGTPAPTAPTTTTPRPTTPQRYQLLYGEFLGANQPIAIRYVSLNSGTVRELGRIAPKHGGRFALRPDGRRLAILDKLDHHEERTTTWRLRMLDLDELREFDLIDERTDADRAVPWDVTYTSDGALLLASRGSLDRVDEHDGSRATLLRFPEGTVGVTFRDPVHPGLLVAQSAAAYTVYLVDGATPRQIAGRDLVGIMNYARRPGTDEVVELVTRFDGTVSYSMLRGDGSESRFALQGPKAEGIVDLIGTTAEGAYLIWPIAQDDPAALGVLASALIYKVGYDAKLTLLEGVRNWGEYGPLGVSPDGRALLVPDGKAPASDADFAIRVCCERRPATVLLPFGDRFVIGWLAER